VGYVVEVEPRDDEIDRDNNRRRQSVSIRDEKIRVLIVQAYPSYEFRFLKSLLERDRTIELSTYLQEADADYIQQDESAIRAFPVAREALFEYDVLLLGDVNPMLLPRSIWQNVQAMVEEKGAGLAMIAGPRYFPWLYRDNTEIRRLLPVELETIEPPGQDADLASGFPVQPTSLGLRTASMQLGDSLAATRDIWQSLPRLYWLAEIGQTKPAAQVLAEHPTRTGANGQNLPVICMQYFGNGRVLMHATDETWRWRFRIGDVFFARYWVQSIRFLARSKLAGRGGAELTVDRRQFRSGETAQMRLRFFDERIAPATDDGVTVVIEAAGQPRRRLTLHRIAGQRAVFEGSLTNLVEGTYRLLLVQPAIDGNPVSAQFTVVAPPGEFERVEMDRAALTAAAKATHGKFYTFAAADRLLDDLPAGRPVPIDSLPPVPLWNRSWVLSLLLVLLIAEWVLRRRKGML
jgi:hypothetical protein